MMELSQQAEQRYNIPEATSYESIFQRNIGLYSREMQRVLYNSTVAIAGVGGPGSIIAVTLARNGVGRLRIADPEDFDPHNINRQYGAKASTIGRNKTEVMGEILRDINPYLTLEEFPQGVHKNNLDDFLDGADVVVDAIDYQAPREKRDFYRTAREKGLYVLTSPIGGLGTLVMCFNPTGITMEEVFAFPKDETKIDTHHIPTQRITGCELGYVTPFFHETMKLDPPYISTNGSSCATSAGPVSVDILKILMLRERERNPQAFPHLDNISLIEMPFARRIDLWDPSLDGVVNVMELEATQ